MDGVRLDLLLDGVAGVLADLREVPPGGAPVITGTAILDPDDEVGDHHGELVLLIGARGREAVAHLRAAARGGAVAVAVKVGAAAAEPAAAEELAAVASDTGLALLAVRPEVRWDQLGELLRERLEASGAGRDSGGADPGGEDLYTLAETTALLTGGIVSIEDTGNRVLAYSRSDQDVDEMRRLSILGWQGPESYMATLRRWGVLDRLRARDEVVRVDDHPELGIRARLAVGMRAGPRYLGAIWVQQRSPEEPFTVHAEDALRGAARLAAAEITRRRAGLGSGSRHRDLLAGLLAGDTNVDLAAGRLGMDPAASALVVAFGGPVEVDAPTRRLSVEQVRGVVSVYATAYHRTARVAALDERVYVVLSGVSGPAEAPTRRRGPGGGPGWVADAVEAIRARTGPGWRAGIGSPVPTLAGLADTRAEADRVLEVLHRVPDGPSARVSASITDLRAEVLLGEVLEVLAARPELRHPGIAALSEHDAERGGELVASLLAYLDALGDVRAASAALHVHPNTLRHRLRRARALSGVAWDDPRERLAGHLELVLLTRGARAVR
jgi:hypothetical protein